MSFLGFPANFGRHAKLASLAPLDAARALLRFEFGIDEEPALFFALRRDPRITLDDDAMMDLFMDLVEDADHLDDALDEQFTPEAFLEMLAEANPRPPKRRR